MAKQRPDIGSRPVRALPTPSMKELALTESEGIADAGAEGVPGQHDGGADGGAEGPADGGAQGTPGEHDGGADGGAEGPADGGADGTTGEHDGGADGGA